MSPGKKQKTEKILSDFEILEENLETSTWEQGVDPAGIEFSMIEISDLLGNFSEQTGAQFG